MGEDLDRIRERKLEELREQAQSGGTSTAGASAETPITVDGPDHFSQLLSDHELVLVDFYADWCGPCQMIAPVLERLAADMPVTVLKVDTDMQQSIAAEHGVRSLPTLLLVQNGDVVERLIGAQDESRLRSLIERFAG